MNDGPSPAFVERLHGSVFAREGNAMVSEIEDVPYDADLVMRVLEDHNIPAKRLAMHLGLHRATIHKYLSGILTIPSAMLRGVFELTGGDLRILALITGTIPVTIHALGDHGSTGNRPERIPPLDELLSTTCRANESLAKAIPYMGKILRDGKIDASDLQAIEQFKKHSSEAARCNGLVAAALAQQTRKAGL